MIGQRPFVVVVTGSECTGKTTLAQYLAAHLGVSASAEFAREYVTRKRGLLDETDVEPIARGQLAGEDAAAAGGAAIVVKDTDLISTVVYAHHYYGSCPSWIERAAQARLGDLYLLLHPDVPWVADGFQRDRPESRDLLHDLFRNRLAAFGATVIEVAGDWTRRRAAALDAVSRLLEDKAGRGHAVPEL